MKPLRGTRQRVAHAWVGPERGAAISPFVNSRAEARELRRLSRIPALEPATTSIFGSPFKVPDVPTFLEQYEEIIRNQYMAFTIDNPQPTIIDGGANAGVATVFFKRMYPSAKIIAFEADPHIAAILQRNIASLGLANVSVVEAALWSESGAVRFWSEGRDAGRVGDDPPRGGSPVVVTSVTLGDYLNQHVDLLKLDIEGAEYAVLTSAEPLLGNVDRILFEYHSLTRSSQRLGNLLDVLARAGFRYFVQSGNPPVPPFLDSHEWNGFDNQLLIAARRLPVDAVQHEPRTEAIDGSS